MGKRDVPPNGTPAPSKPSHTPPPPRRPGPSVNPKPTGPTPQRPARFAAALVAALLSVFGIAAPAYAAQNCPSSAICFYDTSVSASPFHYRDNADTSSGECHTVGTGTSWVRNQTSRSWTLYTSSLCSGFPQLTVSANSSKAMPSNMNNIVRSYKRN